MPMKFRLRWIPLIATVIVAAIGIELGQWQTRRAVEKETIGATLATRASMPPLTLDGSPRNLEEVEYRRVRVRGRFLRDWPVYLDNRPHDGAAGLVVLMPFRIVDSDRVVLVARGWVARDPADRTRLPHLLTPEGVIEIEGVGRSNPGRLLQLGDAEPLRPGAIVQNADIAAFAGAGQWPMQPFIIEQSTDLQDGLVRDWPMPSLGADKHRGYAFQWYALAATALIFFVVTGIRRERK